MRRLGYLLLILLCARHSSLGATLDGSSTSAGGSSLASEDSVHNGDSVPIDPDSMLDTAIMGRNLDGIKLALSRGANPNRVRHYKSVMECLLMFSCVGSSGSVADERQQACLQMLAALFDAGARLQAADHGVLYWPISAGYSNVVQMLLSRGAKADGCSDDGRTWVEVAEAEEQRSIVDLLVDNGGKRVPPQDARQLRLLEAIRSHRFMQVVRAIREGASASEPDKTGMTPLTALVGDARYDCDRYATLVYLLKNGADPSKEGRGCFKGIPGLPLHTAMFTTQIDFTLYGRSPDARKSDARIEHADYARLIVETLLETGARVAVRSEDGKTPLHCAAQFGNLIGAELLLKAGSTIMPRDDAGKTPLDYAESAEMIKLLKDHGAAEH